jgi:excisionase family DNA binding protein
MPATEQRIISLKNIDKIAQLRIIAHMNTLDAISTHQAAEKLGVSYRTIQEWLKRGHFPHAFRLDPLSKSRSHLRIPVEDIDRIIQLRRQENRTG